MSDKHLHIGPVRKYVYQGGVYVVRDRWESMPPSPSGYIRSEYAVRNPNGSKRWVPTYEGVMFKDIEPLRMRRG